MSYFNSDSALQAYLSELILPTHLRGDPGKSSIQDILNGYNTPGISVAVLPPSGNAEYSKTPLITSAFGLRDVGDPASVIDPETIFQAASISKPFTALAVLRLVAQGKLDLDTDIGEYLADIKRDSLHHSALVNPATAPRTPITLRLLLSHKSGLSTVAGFDGYNAQLTPMPSTISILNGTAPSNSLPIRAFTLPGLGTSYSGGGTTLVQHILTLVTGKDFPTLMKELVLEPLGMSRSTYEQQASRVNFACGHPTAYTGFHGGTECMIYPEMAAAGLWTTPSDILKGLRAVYDCLSGSNQSFLPPALVADSFTATNGFGKYGIGWRVQTLSTDEGARKRRMVIEHGGANQGFRCWVLLVGDVPVAGEPLGVDSKPPLGIAVMTNSDHGLQLGGRIMTAFGWAVGEPITLGGVASEQYFPVLATTPEEEGRVARQIEGWQAWAGDWRMKEGGVALTIGEEDGRPVVSMLGLHQLVLLPAAVHHTSPEEIKVWVVRDMDVAVIMKDAGKAVEIRQNEMEYAAERVVPSGDT
ncbi:beta-lactamase/transpeptidase-like protein [Roridomyces roridus]|uniref:Beta-lactamase/transpeptidase-like protein n=1 Tax=Roridomyces roridus TaxID=1738132 RepID=A0AAD7BF36_9AGAR|nr:beta-lactamase/transpeptidase-like protein [Roridomyces roridus]